MSWAQLLAKGAKAIQGAKATQAGAQAAKGAQADQGGLGSMLESLLGAGKGGWGTAPSPPPSDNKSKTADLFKRLKGTQGGAELTPPPAPEPLKQQTRREKWEGIGNKVASGIDTFSARIQGISDPDGMIERGRKRKGFLGGAQTTAGYGLKALQNESELGGIGDLMGGAGEAAGHIPVIGKPIGAFLKLGETVIKSVDKLKQWNEQIHQGNMRFAEFSGAMASVQAQQEIRDIQLSQERGDRRAGTARLQAEQKHQMNKNLALLEDTWGNLKNLGSAGLNALGNKLAEVTNNLTGWGDSLEKFNELLNKMTGDDPEMVGNWLEEGAGAANMEYAYQKYGRPKRHN